MPAIKRPMDMYVATIEGSPPASVDYSWAYDTASGEILLNTMDPLIQYAGESLSSFIGDIAYAWTGTSGNLNGNAPIRLTGTYGSTLPDGYGGIDSGIPISGLTFENTGQPGVDATYYYRYDFKINQTALGDATFWPPYTYGSTSLTPGPLLISDIVYSFQRTVIQDRTTGPQWMLQEPLLDNAGGDTIATYGIADPTNETQISELGQLIGNMMGSNSTDIWFNVMYPGPYGALLEVLTQTWASIIREAWVNTIVIGAAGRHDWNGIIATAMTPSMKAYTTYGWTGTPPAYTAWLDDWLGTGLSPFDTPTMISYGDGPFILNTVDLTNNYWSASRYGAYWRGWPAKFPTQAGVSPAGYVNTIEVTWNFVWGTRLTMFLDGDCDFCALGMNSQLPQLYGGATDEYPFDTSSSNYPAAGIQCIAPLPELEVDALYFTFNISTSTSLVTLLPPGHFGSTGIPPDLFGMQENATANGWSKDIRLAFAYAFDYNTYISTVDAGLATHPATAIIPGLEYYDPTVTGFSLDIATATNYLKATPLWSSGMTIKLYYNTGNTARYEAAELEAEGLTAAVAGAPGHFTIQAVGLPWATYLLAMEYSQVPMFIVGWLADYPDPHDFAFPFYDSSGTYGLSEMLPSASAPYPWLSGASTPTKNVTEDQEILLGASTPDGPARAAIYSQIQKDVIAYCPGFTLDQPIGYHFQQDWVQGYYYNAMYPGPYFYNQWKWYYCPQALLSSTPSGSKSEYNCADIEYSGVVDISSVAAAAAAFGASYGPPMSSNWIYRADVTNDRIVDISDIAYIASCFGESSIPWSTVLSVSVSPGVTSLANATQTATLTATTAFATGSVTFKWYNDAGVLLATSAPTPSSGGVATDAYPFAPSALGTYSFFCNVTDSTLATAKSNTVFVFVGPQVTISSDTGMVRKWNVSTTDTVACSAVANGGTTPYTYNWYYQETSPTPRAAVAFPAAVNGASSLTFDNTVMNSTNLLDIPGSYNIYCVVTDNVGLTVTSNIVVLNVVS
jgi:peptide/nickel transport system substrate-binding protein